MPGRLLGGRYQVQDRIGTGGMATVYRGQDEVLGRTVAIKTMLPQYANDPSFAARFKQEAQAAAALQSPYIVSVYDWGKDGDTYYIIMEYLRGTDLKSGIKKHGALDCKKVAQIGSQIAQALSVAHRHDIIHRDIKPQNIMVQPDGNIKVMDFGIARAKNSHLTQDNSVLGTAHYVSPEQAQGKDLGPTSDLYSLGVVMYEAATGRLPFEGDDAVSVALKQVNEQPVPPRSINPNLDPALEAIIMCLLRKDPAQRFQTADELRHALNSFIQGNPVNIPGFGPAATRSLPTASQTNVMRSNPNMTVMQQGPSRTARMERTATPNDRRAAMQREDKRLERAENTSKSTGIAIAAVVIVLIVLVVVAFTALNSCSNNTPGTPGDNATITTKVEKKSVPNVQNLTQAAAKNKLESNGLKLGLITTEMSNTVSKGKVISQSVAAGTEVDAGTAVNLVISGGTDLVTFDDIRGKTPEEANTLISAAGLKLSHDATLDAYSNDYAEGTIVTFSPANKSIAKGSTVTYGLSKGSQTFTLDSYYGWNYTDVEAVLKEAKVSYEEQRTYSDDLAEGLVIWTDPGAGATVKQGDTVVIYISQGKDPNAVQIDSYVGQDYNTVKSTLEGLDLTVNLIEQTPDSADQSGKCAGTDPHNTSVAKGSTVNLYYYGTYTPPAPSTPSVTIGSYTGDLGTVENTLDSLGLSYSVVTGDPAPSSDLVGQVYSMSPANTTVDASTTITLYVYGDVSYDDTGSGTE